MSLRLNQYQEQNTIAFTLLIKSYHLDEPFDLKELMAYQLTPVPHSVATTDGLFSKIYNAALMNDCVPYPEGALYIQEGMALLHVLTNLEPIFGDIFLQILAKILGKILSTDSYEPESIKSHE